MAQSLTAKFACMTCGRQYQHSSHLRRHEATHLDLEQFGCKHCGKRFRRRDVWRKHSASCQNNNNRENPPLAKRGQKPRACDTCFRSKLSCDGRPLCGRCESRQLQCTYDRAHTNGKDGVSPSKSPSTASTVAADTDASTKIPVSFLLGLTNPQAKSMVEVFFDEPGRDDDAPSVLLQPDPDPGFLAGFAQDPLLSGGFFVLGLGQSAHDTLLEDNIGDSNQPSGTELSHTAVDPFLSPILASLTSLHNHLLTTDPSYTGPFNHTVARQIFLPPSNRETFTSAYFRHTHRDLPLVHRPTFDPATSSPALLLAIFLAGSQYAAPRDCVLAIPSFFRIAEEFVFRELDAQLQAAAGCGADRAGTTRTLSSGGTGSPTITTTTTTSAEAQAPPPLSMSMWPLYEALQAGLLMHGIQFVSGDVAARRRSRTVRLPVLVDAVRRLGWTGARQTQPPAVGGGMPDWAWFVGDEMRIRIARWTLLADWHQNGAFHVPSLMTVGEMTGDMTCLEELWEANDVVEFEAVIAARGRDCWRRASSLKEGVDALMGEDWTGADRFPIPHLSVLDLQVLVLAMMSVIATARLMSLLPVSAPAILRAIDRWEELWGTVAGRVDPEQLRMSGYARHSGEMCWVARRLVEFSLSGRDRTSAYFQRIGHDSPDELHALLRELRDS
ncbi:Zn(2)-C6 fungal-type domain-containing protein [Madurella fahalii]|uniref:Zn(2)-C6 fungal-type domain-containing protein n=1 Tax=Madurella fahalii TaxID=1157608 RepID=A0ABQ0GT99_9PEZI